MSNPRGDAFALACPKDAATMDRIPLGGFTVDKCTQCGALWFDALELQKALAIPNATQKLEPGVAPKASEADHACDCPRCKSPLVRMRDRRQGHVELLTCTVCGGVLLDKGEFADLTSYTFVERLKSFFSLS